MSKVTEIKIEYTPFPEQLKFHESPSRIRALIAGIGGGKTYAGANELIKRALITPKSYWVAIAPTYAMLRDIDIPAVEKFLPKKLIYDWNKTDKIYTLKNGSRIQFLSADTPDRLRGIGPDGIWIDEAREVSSYAWKIIYTRATRGKRALIWITTTPNGHDWTYEEVYKPFFNKNPDYFCVLYKSTDNPYFDSTTADEARAKLSEEFYRQEYEASFEQFTGRVYKDFSRDIHVIDPMELPREWSRFRSIDFGYTNPFVCLWICVDYDNNVYVYKEHYERERTSEYHVEMIKSKSVNEVYRATYGDPSAKQLIEDFVKLGLYITPGINDVAEGVTKVTGALKVNEHTGKPKLYVFRGCENVIEEFEKYRYKDEKGEVNPREEPLKKDDHSMDALRYFFSTYFQPVREERDPYIREYQTAYQGTY